MRNKISRVMASFIFSGLLLGVAGVRLARAALISQPANTCAAFPIHITKSGSYALASNINVTCDGKNAILIEVDNVTLDLNGFGIKGPGLGSGSGDGVLSFNAQITIRNGSVVSMDGNGILLAGDGEIVEGVQASGNGGDGITLESRGTATGNTSNFNHTGIDCTNDCVISGNTTNNNRRDGIAIIGTGGLITGNAASGNDCDGLFNGDSSDGYSNNVMNGNNLGGHPSNCATGCLDVCGGTSMGFVTNLCSGGGC